MAFGMHSSMMFMKGLFHFFQLMLMSEWSKREFQLVASISSQARSQSARLYLHTVLVLTFIGLTDLRRRRASSPRWSELDSACIVIN